MLGCGAERRNLLAARIGELESYSESLERELTELKEKRLSEERSYCNAKDGSPSREPVAVGPASDGPLRRGALEGAPSRLPVLHLSPEGTATAAPSKSATLAQVVPAAGDADRSSGEEPSAPHDSSTSTVDSEDSRPVLHVHGTQEGRVYHRALTALEREDVTSSP